MDRGDANRETAPFVLSLCFFLLVGALIMLPAVLGYTAFSYSVFRGKVVAGEGCG